MHNNLTATYHALMSSLTTLPDEIAAAQDELTQAKLDLSSSDKTLNEIESAQALNVEGKNAEERKAKLAHELNLRSDYQFVSKQRAERQRNVAMLTNGVDNLTRQFAAVGYQAKLHAGMLAYLASAFPGQAMDLDNPVAPLNVNGNGSISAADAADIGL